MPAAPTTQDATFDTAAGPSFGPSVDEALLAERVRQLAITDAASGAYDETYARAHEGLLPSEAYIARQIDRLVGESGLHAADAQSTDRGYEFPVAHGGEIPTGADGELLAEQRSLEMLVADIDAVIATAETEEGAAIATLQGEIPWRDGAKFTGAVPPRPVLSAAEGVSVAKARVALARRPERMTRWMVDIGFTLIGALPDYAILTVIFGAALRTDNLLETAALAFGATASGVGVPHVIGVMLAKILRGARYGARMLIALGLLAALWIGVATQVATLRTTAERDRTIRSIAAIDGIPTESVDLTDRFDPVAQWIIWFMLVLAIGVVVIGLKIAFSNPALTSLVKSQSTLTVGRLRRANLVGRLARITAKLEALRDVAAITQGQFAAQPGVLRRLRDELIALYRTTFISALADPAISGHLTDVPEIAEERGDRA